MTHHSEQLIRSNSMDKSHNFPISKETLISIATAAQQRTFSEEIDLIESLGGYEFIEMALSTSFKNGLKGDDFPMRIAAFGDNKRPELEPSTFL